MNYSIGFIGGGRVARILLQGFNNKAFKFNKIAVTDTNPDVLASLKKQFPAVEGSNLKDVAKQDIVFIALHPPVVMDTLELIKGDAGTDTVVISLAPKINLTKLSSKLAQVKCFARLIPNATSYINEGFNPVTFSAGFDSTRKEEILKLLEGLGHTFEVPEEKLESYAIMSAMLPTYFWFQWKELADIGVRIGLSENEARESIDRTIVSSLDLLYRSGLSSQEVIDLIPVRPIGEYEPQIVEIYKSKLIGLFEKIKP